MRSVGHDGGHAVWKGTPPLSGRLRSGWRPAPTSGVGFLLVAGAILGTTLAGRTAHLLDFPFLTAIVISLLGVPHGAFDVALARNRWDLGTSVRFSIFLAVYVGLAGAVLAIWTFLPVFALPCFLLVSGLHFSGNWKDCLDRPGRMLIGVAIITSPAVLHDAEVREIFTWIVPSPVAAVVPIVMGWLAVPSLLCSVIVLSALARSHPMAVLETSAVVALALFTEPLCFSVLYFCGLHSVRHVEAAYRELCPRSVITFFRQSVPYAPLAIVGTALGGWWSIHRGIDTTMLGGVFISLAALTAPHMLLVDPRRPTPK